MTDSPIAAALREVDAACPICIHYGHHLRKSCKGIIHRLARELAKVAQVEEAKECLTIYDSLSWVNDNPKIREALVEELNRIAALPIEGTDE